MKFLNMLILSVTLILSACGGSSGGGGGGGDTTPDTTLSLSVSTNTLVQGATPTVRVTANKSVLTSDTTISIDSFSCSSKTLVSSTEMDCVVDSNVTTTPNFVKLSLEAGDMSGSANLQVVSANPRTEDYNGAKETGTRFLTSAGTDTISLNGGSNDSARAGLDSGKFFISLNNDTSATTNNQVMNRCPQEGDNFHMINMAKKSLSDADNFNKVGMTLEFVSDTSATVKYTSTQGESSSTTYKVFCNENKEVALYTDDSPRIDRVYRFVSNEEWGVLSSSSSNELFMGSRNDVGDTPNQAVTSTINAGSGTELTANEGYRYTLDTTSTADNLGTNLVSVKVGTLCDDTGNPIAGSDRLFLKSREKIGGGVATGTEWNNEQVYYYEMIVTSDNNGIVKGIYDGDSTLTGCIAKEKAGGAGNDKVFGSFYNAGSRAVVLSLTMESYTNTNLSIDALYLLNDMNL